jgi:hypothetical protein
LAKKVFDYIIFGYAIFYAKIINLINVKGNFVKKTSEEQKTIKTWLVLFNDPPKSRLQNQNTVI